MSIIEIINICLELFSYSFDIEKKVDFNKSEDQYIFHEVEFEYFDNKGILNEVYLNLEGIVYMKDGEASFHNPFPRDFCFSENQSEGYIIDDFLFNDINLIINDKIKKIDYGYMQQKLLNYIKLYKT